MTRHRRSSTCRLVADTAYGSAPNLHFLVAMRVLQGLGGGAKDYEPSVDAEAPQSGGHCFPLRSGGQNDPGASKLDQFRREGSCARLSM